MKSGKNRYYQRSKISEARFRRLMRAFALDLMATDAAQLTGLSVRRNWWRSRLTSSRSSPTEASPPGSGAGAYLACQARRLWSLTPTAA